MEKLYIIGRDECPRELIVHGGETLNLSFIVLPGVSCKLDLDLDICGPGADVTLSGLYVCPADERVEFNIVLKHTAGGSVSRQLFKGLVGGTARSSFNGLVVVAQDAQHSEASQSNHNLLLSEGAEALTSPQLEIYADDVKCSHGATIGRLNEDEQFYMRSRGISLREAKLLQMMAFASPVLENVNPESRREEIRSIVESAIRTMID